MGENKKRRRAGLHRAELLQVLFDAVSANKHIKMHTDKRVSGLEKISEKEMKLTFQDGTTATANLVIGADGIHSVVRSHYLKDEPIFSGYVAYRGLIPMEQVREFWPYEDSDVSGFWTQQGKHFMTYLASKKSNLTSKISHLHGRPYSQHRRLCVWPQKPAQERILGFQGAKVGGL